MTNLLRRLNNRSFIKSTRFCSYNLNDLLLSMPKEPKHIVEAQEQRRKIKAKFSKYVPGRITLQVLGTGAKGAPRSLYVFSDQSRYLFNCGEGTQRLAHEHKMKLAKLEHIFITQGTWNNIGGLPGTALTIQDVGVPQIILHGPDGLEELFIATRRFVVLKDLKIQMAECNESTTFEDNVMSVKYVPLSKELSENNENLQETQKDDIIEDDTDYYAHETSGKRAPIENINFAQLMVRGKNKKNTVMNYVCNLRPRPGALSLEKCVQLGVPPGPILGKLKNGEDVTLANGTEVKSADVCEPDDPGPIFLVIDCPSEEYLDSLVNNTEFKKYQSETTHSDDLACLVVHFTPQNIMENPKYQEWIDRFSPSTQHLVLNESNGCMGSISVHRIQYKLNLLNDSIFPLLGDDGTKIEAVENESTFKRLKTESGPNSTRAQQNSSESDNISWPYRCNTFCNFHLRPRNGLDRSTELKISPDQYIEETMALKDFPKVVQELKENLARKSKELTIRAYPKILFLGTGSCIPNKTRNTSAILLQINESRNILLDCGEGTYGQIVRFFGKKRADKILIDTKAIYVSHLHADHHIGLIGVLNGRRKALLNDCEPLMLFAPKQILSWLNFYDGFFEEIAKDFNLVPNSDLLFDRGNNFDDTSKALLGLQGINTTHVRHCPNAFGVTLILDDGYKITYSGDTMPSDNLITLGMDSDLLIHEATMEDDLAEEAVIKMHSTTSQAISVGKSMKAKHILLTHFSQRYAKLPRFNDNFEDNVGIAFDNMQVRVDELPLLPLFYPAMKLMFAEQYEELEIKANKRQMKMERAKLLASL